MAKGDKNSKTVNLGMDKEERQKALDIALSGIEKAYGKGTIMKLGDKSSV